MTDHHAEQEIKIEQHHIPPELPDDPVQLEQEKRQMARLIPVVVIALAILFVVIALLIVL